MTNNGDPETSSAQQETDGDDSYEKSDNADQQQTEEQSRTELLNRLTRAQADLANFRRRSAQETQDARQFANQLFAVELLGVLDSLDRALISVPGKLRSFSWIDGIMLTRMQFDHLLKSQGVERINALGQKFDPAEHDAVEADEDLEDSGTVVEEFQAGYKMHGKVIRPALVRVGATVNDDDDDSEIIEESN
tara:strand:- start:637 stop:1212 length:576 start_codon:yes stop_codon:yes gene_type:complete